MRYFDKPPIGVRPLKPTIVERLYRYRMADAPSNHAPLSNEELHEFVLWLGLVPKVTTKRQQKSSPNFHTWVGVRESERPFVSPIGIKMTATTAAKRRFSKHGANNSSSLLCTIDELEQATLFDNGDDSHSIDDDEASIQSSSTSTSTGMTNGGGGGGGISSSNNDDDYASGKRRGYYYYHSLSLSPFFRSTWFLTCWWRVRSLYHRYRCGNRNNPRRDHYRIGNRGFTSSTSGGTSPASKRVFGLLVGLYVVSTVIFTVHPLRVLLPLLGYHRRLNYYDVNDDALSFIHYDAAFTGGASTSAPAAVAGGGGVSNIIDMNILLKWPKPPSQSSSGPSNNRNFHLADKLGAIPESDWNVPDYGNLTVIPSPYNRQQNHNHNQRVVNSNDLETYESDREEYIKVMDDAEHIGKEYWSHEDVQDIYEKCRTPTWKSTAIPTCNVAHELSLERVKKIHRPRDGNYDESLQDYNMTYMGYVKPFQEEEEVCIVPLGGMTVYFVAQFFGLYFPSIFSSHSSLCPCSLLSLIWLSSGTYRDAFRYEREDGTLPNGRDDFVIKRLLYRRGFVQYDLYKIRKEASIFDQLSAAPLVLDMYGYCGGSVLVESMDKNLWKYVIYQKTKGQYSQSELDKMDHPSMNNFTIAEKLQMALEMAESLAAMHGNKGGEIVHADTHIEQWLLDSHGTTKLNDFNNAVISTWDDKKGDYCYHGRSYGGIVSYNLSVLAHAF